MSERTRRIMWQMYERRCAHCTDIIEHPDDGYVLTVLSNTNESWMLCPDCYESVRQMARAQRNRLGFNPHNTAYRCDSCGRIFDEHNYSMVRTMLVHNCGDPTDNEDIFICRDCLNDLRKWLSDPSMPNGREENFIEKLREKRACEAQ